MSAGSPALRRTLGQALGDIVGYGERLAFWAGVALPCVHLPVLAFEGLTRKTMPILVALWTLHAIALVVGSRYRPNGD